MGTIRTSMLLSALMFLAIPVFGQEAKRYGQRYVFVGVGGWPAELGSELLISTGFGGEKRMHGGLGLGGELQAFVQPKDGHYYGGGTVSANGIYNFRSGARAPGKLFPFGTGGFSAVVLCAGQCWPTVGFNFGGGVTYWRTAGHGLRLEFRDTVTKDYGATHLWEVRTGFSF
jgi:hypothetical protein